jgi:hypothetical protein
VPAPTLRDRVKGLRPVVGTSFSLPSLMLILAPQVARHKNTPWVARYKTAPQVARLKIPPHVARPNTQAHLRTPLQAC